MTWMGGLTVWIPDSSEELDQQLWQQVRVIFGGKPGL